MTFRIRLNIACARALLILPRPMRLLPPFRPPSVGSLALNSQEARARDHGDGELEQDRTRTTIYAWMQNMK